MIQSREVRLKRRPVGLPTHDDFELAAVTLPDPDPGEVQVRNLWMSVDPYMRGRMNDAASYAAPYELGKVMYGGAVGSVVASNVPSLQVGDLVQGNFAWREAYNAPAGAVQKIDARLGLAPQAYLGVAGATGLTAYVGLLRIAALKAGDVVFVSGGAGAVGSVACQIAKAKGHLVVASAGGATKRAALEQLGVDHVIDYKEEQRLARAILAGAPQGVDVYFDNVGGAHLEAALVTARPQARFALCGMISQYNSTDAGPGTRGLALAIAKSLTLRGFIVSDHLDMYGPFLNDMQGWMAEGKVRSWETEREGIDCAVDAFLGLFSGDNLGKMLVKLS